MLLFGYECIKFSIRGSDRVADELRTAITRRAFAAGTCLPTEHQLAQDFGVSRSVVREAVLCHLAGATKRLAAAAHTH